MHFKITALLLVFCLFIKVDAHCNCAAGDTACLEHCVASGQACVVSCDGDLDCYNQCIQSHWPGQTQSVDMTTTSVVTMTTLSVATTTHVASTTAAAAASIVPTIVPSGNSSISTNYTSNITNNTTIQPLSTFSPIPPTSSTAPSQTNTGNSKPFLVPAVAIGVASVTVMVQFFFLARMGTMLFH